jgi:hypothetical protein
MPGDRKGMPTVLGKSTADSMRCIARRAVVGLCPLTDIYTSEISDPVQSLFHKEK